jgi:hypothetical protein
MTQAILPVDGENGTPGTAATCRELMPLWGQKSNVPRRRSASTEGLCESFNLARSVSLRTDDCPSHRDAPSIATPSIASLKAQGR